MNTMMEDRKTANLIKIVGDSFISPKSLTLLKIIHKWA